MTKNRMLWAGLALLFVADPVLAQYAAPDPAGSGAGTS